MDEAVKKLIWDTVEEMLADPTVKFELSVGTQRIDRPGEQWMRYAKTKGKTLVLSVHGGAKDLDQKGDELPTIARQTLEARLEAHRRKYGQ